MNPKEAGGRMKLVLFCPGTRKSGGVVDFGGESGENRPEFANLVASVSSWTSDVKIGHEEFF